MKDKKSPLPPPPPTASPFAALAGLVAPSSAADTAVSANREEHKKPASRGRVDVLRSTAHRGGKTVTVLKGFTGVEAAELQTLAKQMQKRCGAGGTVKDGVIEIQGDHRETVMRLLTEAGFRPVKAGG